MCTKLLGRLLAVEPKTWPSSLNATPHVLLLVRAT
jgi:hypothetical protein